MQTVARIIEIFGGLERLADHPIRLEVEGFMPLCIEYLGTGPRGLPLVSVTHYYEQNGDLLSDPDCTFEIDGAHWLPVSYQQDTVGLYQEVLRPEAGQATINERLEQELLRFAVLWDRNLLEQGYLAEAERRTRAAPVRVTLLAATEGMKARQLIFEVQQGSRRQLIRMHVDEKGDIHFGQPVEGQVRVGNQAVLLVEVMRRLAGQCSPDEVGRTWTPDEIWPALQLDQ